MISYVAVDVPPADDPDYELLGTGQKVAWMLMTGATAALIQVGA